LLAIAIIFGRQAAQRLTFKLLRVRKIKKEHDKRQRSERSKDSIASSKAT